MRAVEVNVSVCFPNMSIVDLDGGRCRPPCYVGRDMPAPTGRPSALAASEQEEGPQRAPYPPSSTPIS